MARSPPDEDSRSAALAPESAAAMSMRRTRDGTKLKQAFDRA
jgi:hypothetical protein